MMTMELITKFVKFMAQALVSFVRWGQNSNIVKFKKKNTQKNRILNMFMKLSEL